MFINVYVLVYYCTMDQTILLNGWTIVKQEESDTLIKNEIYNQHNEESLEDENNFDKYIQCFNSLQYVINY